MELKFVGACPEDVSEREAQWAGALEKFPAIAILFHDAVSTEALNRIAELIVLKKIKVVAVWGIGAERFHDLVDRLSSERFGEGPITIWDGEGTAAEFMWDVAHPYQGLLDVADQDRGALVL